MKAKIKKIKKIKIALSIDSSGDYIIESSPENDPSDLVDDATGWSEFKEELYILDLEVEIPSEPNKKIKRTHKLKL